MLFTFLFHISQFCDNHGLCFSQQDFNILPSSFYHLRHFKPWHPADRKRRQPSDGRLCKPDNIPWRKLYTAAHAHEFCRSLQIPIEQNSTPCTDNSFNGYFCMYFHC